MRSVCSVFLVLSVLSSARGQGLVVEDIFGRRLNENGLVLVDWDGQIANPAIKFYLVPPAYTVFPARAVLTAKEPRLCFNLPSEIGPKGPRKVIEFKQRQKMPVLMSIFPDRDGKDEDHVVGIAFQDATGRTQNVKLRCHVIDQDKEDAKAFPIAVDFSHDRTGFFKDEKNRQVVSQAAQDWMHFFEPVPLDAVAAGKEMSHILDRDSLKKGQWVANSQEYTGYLLYVSGIESAELRSGGSPSAHAFQSHKGKELFIRRSGSIVIETRGNFSTNGWIVSLKDADYWKATNPANRANDLYSIAHHEIGHALIFHDAIPLCGKAQKKGILEEATLKEYLGGHPKISNVGHLTGTIDPVSRRGAFGNEYEGEMPQCRWLITKLDLICARAIGWPLRESSAFAPLKLQTEELAAGAQGRKYSEKLRAIGGIPFYYWELRAGKLPPGLKLNSFTGEISGRPTRTGSFEFTVRVRDYDKNAAGQSGKLRVEINAAPK
jgi:hypothetical protein